MDTRHVVEIVYLYELSLFNNFPQIIGKSNMSQRKFQDQNTVTRAYLSILVHLTNDVFLENDKDTYIQ